MTPVSDTVPPRRYEPFGLAYAIAAATNPDAPSNPLPLAGAIVGSVHETRGGAAHFSIVFIDSAVQGTDKRVRFKVTVQRDS